MRKIIVIEMFFNILMLPVLVNTKNNDDSCGLVLPGVSRALISGDYEDRAAPWAVSLGYNDQDGLHRHFCTGVIIKEDVILTGAHCIEDKNFNKETFQVVAGVLDLRWAGAAIRKIKQTHVHPKYEKPKVYYDVAVVILTEPFTFSADISSICLPSTALSSIESKVGLGVTIQGWGTNNDGENGQLLTQIDVSIKSKQECNEKFNSTRDRLNKARIKAFIPDLLPDSMFCADSNLDSSQVGVCDGDSGGPAIYRQYQDGVNHYTLLGIVSGSLRCASEEFPDFYTFISHKEILPWINKVANEETHDIDAPVSGGKKQRCSHKVDVVFVLDSSGSEKNFWDTIKEWVEKTVDALHDVGHDTQVGVVVFDDHIDVSHEIYLETHTDGASLKQKIHDLPFLGGGTRIDLGMEEALDLFHHTNGRRPNAHATVVLFTDGKGSDKPLSEVAQPFHDEGIRVIVVAIGKGIDVNDLKSMTKHYGLSDDTHDHFFHVENDIEELTSDTFIQNSIEGCNFASDCLAPNTALTGRVVGEDFTDITSWKECAIKCQEHNQEEKPREACHYFQWNGPGTKNLTTSLQRRYYEGDCILHSQGHCGFYDASCRQKTVTGVYSGSLESCINKGEL